MKRNLQSSRRRSKVVRRANDVVPAHIELFTEIADLLLRHGITPAQVQALMEPAFAHAAARTARLKNGRISYSRVAARTGLRRTVVRDLLRGNTTFVPSPLARLALGWRTDRDFLDGAGKPRPLALDGKQGAFTRLARRHAPDIPKRALVEELVDAGHASLRAKVLHLRRPPSARNLLVSQKFHTSVRALLNDLPEGKRRIDATKRQ
jgi:hypothetical protein